MGLRTGWDWVLVCEGIGEVFQVDCLSGYCLNRGFMRLSDFWDLVLVCGGIS